MTDSFKDYPNRMLSLASNAYSVTADDDPDLASFCRVMNVITNGFVRLTPVDGDAATVFSAVGITFRIWARRIWAAGSTATNIVGL